MFRFDKEVKEHPIYVTLHDKILANVRKAHPELSDVSQECFTWNIMRKYCYTTLWKLELAVVTKRKREKQLKKNRESKFYGGRPTTRLENGEEGQFFKYLTITKGKPMILKCLGKKEYDGEKFGEKNLTLFEINTPERSYNSHMRGEGVLISEEEYNQIKDAWETEEIK